MKKNKVVQAIENMAATTVDSIGEAVSAIGTTFENLHTAQQQRANALAQQNAYEIKMQNALCVQHDLGVSMAGMTPPPGLTVIHDPSNLSYIENYSVNAKNFAYLWQKSVRRYTFKQDELIAIGNRINTRIKMLVSRLNISGYTVADLAVEYPAVCHGFSVIDAHDTADGVVIIVRIR